jgi:phosphomevalonate kinase
VRVFAPGKVVLTGAYAVLEGAPAIVVATSRGAYADTSRAAPLPTPEVRAALGESPAPAIDASALFAEGRKLGLGASASILVASLAAREVVAGADLASRAVRDALFARARAAHAEAQAGGSGVDVAASVHGGVLFYVPGAPTRAALPRGTHLALFACGQSARTSELRAQVDRLAKAAPATYRARMAELGSIAEAARRACDEGVLAGFLLAVAEASEGLARLGADASAPIVPPAVATLAELARREGAAFCVAGAGGGDVAAFVGSAPPSPAFVERAAALGLKALDFDVDEKGVRVVPERPQSAAAPAPTTRDQA